MASHRKNESVDSNSGRSSPLSEDMQKQGPPGSPPLPSINERLGHLRPSRELLEYYRKKIAEYDGEHEEMMAKLDQYKMTYDEQHKITWEQRQREEEIAELQKALSDMQVYLFQEREHVLRLYAENDRLKIRELEDRKKIQTLLMLSGLTEREVSYFMKEPPAKAIVEQKLPPKLKNALDKESNTKVINFKKSSSVPTVTRNKRPIKSDEEEKYLKDNQTLQLQVEALRAQIEEQTKLSKEQVDAMLEDRRVKSEEYETRRQRDEDKVKALTDKLHKTQDLLYDSTKDFLALRYEGRANERKWMADKDKLLRELDEYHSELQMVAPIYRYGNEQVIELASDEELVYDVIDEVEGSAGVESDGGMFYDVAEGDGSNRGGYSGVESDRRLVYSGTGGAGGSAGVAGDGRAVYGGVGRRVGGVSDPGVAYNAADDIGGNIGVVSDGGVVYNVADGMGGGTGIESEEGIIYNATGGAGGNSVGSTGGSVIHSGLGVNRVGSAGVKISGSKVYSGMEENKVGSARVTSGGSVAHSGVGGSRVGSAGVTSGGSVAHSGVGGSRVGSGGITSGRSVAYSGLGGVGSAGVTSGGSLVHGGVGGSRVGSAGVPSGGSIANSGVGGSRVTSGGRIVHSEARGSRVGSAGVPSRESIVHGEAGGIRVGSAGVPSGGSIVHNGVGGSWLGNGGLVSEGGIVHSAAGVVGAKRVGSAGVVNEGRIIRSVTGEVGGSRSGHVGVTSEGGLVRSAASGIRSSSEKSVGAGSKKRVVYRVASRNKVGKAGGGSKIRVIRSGSGLRARGSRREMDVLHVDLERLEGRPRRDEEMASLEYQLKQAHKLADMYREQVIQLEEQLSSIREQGEVGKELFKQRSEKMGKRLELMNQRYTDLERRRNLEVEGFKTDIKHLRQRLKDLEKQLFKVTLGLSEGIDESRPEDIDLLILRNVRRTAGRSKQLMGELKGLKSKVYGLENDLRHL